MISEAKTCTDARCCHQGKPLSLDHFRKAHSPPHCYHYHKRCSDCRRANPIPLPAHLPAPSPSKAKRIQCSKCKHFWSLGRFPLNLQGLKNPYCIFCRNRKTTIQVYINFSRRKCDWSSYI